MPLDPDLLLKAAPIETRQHLTPKDVMLYALGVGASELQYIYEDGLVALPTMAVVMAYPGFVWRDPQYRLDWKKILHGETSIELHAPLPVEGELIGRTSITALYDKGPEKGAIAYQTRSIVDGVGRKIATVRNGVFLRGDGGFGGSSEGQPVPHKMPGGAPDLVVTIATAPNQAAIYRLSGDINPIHIDPTTAAAAGLASPILHGLCTFGMAGRALTQALCGDDPKQLTRIDARFSAPVFPGETIEIRIWRGQGVAAFCALVPERRVLVLNNGYAEFQ